MLPANWRQIAIGVAVLAVFWAGWHSHTIYDGYKLEKAKDKAIVDLGKGETAIVDFNQSFNKVKTNAQDCINKPVPTDLLRLLK